MQGKRGDRVSIVKMEEITGKKFGDKENPLLVSVRSGARASMPGMMDTILNLGLNEDVVEVLSRKSGNPRWAWDCYRRFIQMYSDSVVMVKPWGTGRPMLVISARLAPLPPRSSRMLA